MSAHSVTRGDEWCFVSEILTHIARGTSDADAIVDDEWDEIEIEYVPPEEGGEGGGGGDEAAPPPNAKPSGKGKGKGKLRRFATLERGTSLKDIADRYSSGGSGGASLPESSAEEDDGEAANEDGTGGPKKRKFATLTRKTTLGPFDDDVSACILCLLFVCVCDNVCM